MVRGCPIIRDSPKASVRANGVHQALMLDIIRFVLIQDFFRSIYTG
jgi:hypothetical protein